MFGFLRVKRFFQLEDSSRFDRIEEKRRRRRKRTHKPTRCGA